MDSLKVIIAAVSAAAIDICALVLIMSAYSEKKTGKYRWMRMSSCMELAEGGKVYPLEGDEILLGRHASADIRLPDISVSRYHAVLTVANGIWTITDIGSKSGTYVNGMLIQSCQLHENDMITLGSRRLIFRRKVYKHA